MTLIRAAENASCTMVCCLRLRMPRKFPTIATCLESASILIARANKNLCYSKFMVYYYYGVTTINKN